MSIALLCTCSFFLLLSYRLITYSYSGCIWFISLHALTYKHKDKDQYITSFMDTKFLNPVFDPFQNLQNKQIEYQSVILHRSSAVIIFKNDIFIFPIIIFFFFTLYIFLLRHLLPLSLIAILQLHMFRGPTNNWNRKELLDTREVELRINYLDILLQDYYKKLIAIRHLLFSFEWSFWSSKFRALLDIHQRVLMWFRQGLFSINHPSSDSISEKEIGSCLSILFPFFFSKFQDLVNPAKCLKVSG